MTRSLLILALAGTLPIACSGSSPQPSSSADKPASPAAAPPSGNPPPAPATSAEALPPSGSQPPAPATTAEAIPPAGGRAPRSERAPGAAPASAAPTASTSPASVAPTKPAPPEPTFREVTVPADTPISVTLVTPIASNTSKPEDPIRGTLAKSIVVSGTTVVPSGSEIIGTVVDAKDSGRVKGRASIVFGFDRLIVRGEAHRIQTARVSREAEASTKSDVKKGAIGAGVGAVIGGIVGGGKGAAIGAGVGGTGTVLATKGKEVQLPAGTTVTTRLRSSMTVAVPVKPDNEK